MRNRGAAQGGHARCGMVLGWVAWATVAGGACGDTWVDRVEVTPPMASTGAGDGGSPPESGTGGESGAAGDPSNGGSGGTATDAGPIDVPDPECGNGTWEVGEQCDDDNRRAGDGCSQDCELEACGNGERNRFEQCDDGNRRPFDGCDTLCQNEPPPAACGNGAREMGEECDDGNLEPGDACDGKCKTVACGDKRISAGETCDPPVEGVCAIDCLLLLPNCGDGEVQTDEQEQCDDKNELPGDGCHRCRLECGDGVVKPAYGEQCEPPGSNVGRPCDVQCRWQPVCGDGVFQPGPEQCDASSTIAVPHGFACENCALVEVLDPPPPTDPDADAGAGPTCTPSHASIIPDSGFDIGTAAWLPSTRVTVTHDRVAGALEPGALRMDFAVTPGSGSDDTRLELSNATRCVSVTPANGYDFRALVQAAGPPVFVTVAIRATGFETLDCTGTRQPNLEATSSGRPQAAGWVPYDTTIQATSSTRTILLELLLIKQRGQQATVLWDDLRMVSRDADPRCGNCVLERGAPAAEECDDGNRLARDGCSETCRLEACGDGIKGGDEDCDEGTLLWSDSPTCTPSCRSKTCSGRVGCSETCDVCVAENCATQLAASLDLPGRAMEGPRAGTLYSVIAEDLRECVHRTGCAGATFAASKSKFAPLEGALENCYCGSAVDEACYRQDAADGSCRAEVEAALETVSASEVWVRIGGGPFPLAAAVGQLLVCEGKTAADGADACSGSCTGAPPSCGDGAIQDRRLVDATTLCSAAPDPNACTYYFEECDDGASSDRCDANCFIVTCGNGVLQEDEECDDGNKIADDGCSPECQKDFDCGDKVVTAPFEECDLPAASNPTQVCTAAQYAADPTQCRCDVQTCKRVVCGDGVLAEGEECEPPGAGACDASCKLPRNQCLECVRKVKTNDQCVYAPYLDGEPPADYPDFEVPSFFTNGCLADGPCYEALTCILRTQCLDSGLDASAGHWQPCFCAKGVPGAQCTDLPLPGAGPCYSQLFNAFEAQFGGPPSNMADLVNGITNEAGTAAGRFASGAAATQLIDSCVGSATLPKIGDHILLSLCPDPATSCPQEAMEQAAQCELACFPPL